MLPFGPICAVGVCQSLYCALRDAGGQSNPVTATEPSLGLNQSPLRAILAPALTDAAIDLKTHESTPLAVPVNEVPVICFYRVTLPEYVIESGMIRSGPVELDSYFTSGSLR